MSTGGGINHMSTMGGIRFGGNPREGHGPSSRHGGSRADNMSMMGGSRFGGEPRKEHGHRNRHGGSERMDGSRHGGSAAGGRSGRDFRDDGVFGFEGGFRQRRY